MALPEGISSYPTLPQVTKPDIASSVPLLPLEFLKLLSPPCVSRLLVDSATLGGRPDGRLFGNLDSIDKDLFFSLLKVSARSAPSVVSSWMVLGSRKTLGKIPHFPLALVPDQHQ